MSKEASDALEAGSTCIASVIENRAKEVGLAILDRVHLKLLLMQLIETSRLAPHSFLLQYQLAASVTAQIQSRRH